MNKIIFNIIKSFIHGTVFFIQFTFIRKLLTLLFYQFIESDENKKKEYKEKYFNETIIDGVFASLSIVFITIIKSFIFGKVQNLYVDNFSYYNIFMAITHSFLWGFFYFYIRKLLLVNYLKGKIDIDIRKYIYDGLCGTIAQIILRLTLEYIKKYYQIQNKSLILNFSILSIFWSIAFIFIRKSYDFKNLNKYAIDGLFGGISFAIKTIAFGLVLNKMKLPNKKIPVETVEAVPIGIKSAAETITIAASAPIK